MQSEIARQKKKAKVQKMMKAFQCKKPKESSSQKCEKESIASKAVESEDEAKRVIFRYPDNFFQAFI